MKNLKLVSCVVLFVLFSVSVFAQNGQSKKRGYVETVSGVELYLEEVFSVNTRAPGNKIILKNTNRYAVSVAIERRLPENKSSYLNGQTVIGIGGGKEGSDGLAHFYPIAVKIISVEAR